MSATNALQFTVALADNAVLKDMAVVSCSGQEQLSQTWRWSIELESGKQAAGVDLNGLLQQEATLVITRGTASERVPGVITAVERPSGGAGYQQCYLITLEPKLALAVHTRRCRVFAKRLKLQPLVQQVLGEHGVSAEYFWEGGDLAQRDWPTAMQWQEHDLAFIARLLENEGAFYWFDFPPQGPAKLRIGNARNCHPAKGIPATLRPDGAGPAQGGTVTSFTTTEQVTVQEAAILEYQPKGGAYARSQAKGQHAHGIGTVTDHTASVPFRAAGKAHGDLAKLRAAAAWCNQSVFHGASDVSALRAGRLLTLSGHPTEKASADFLVLAVRHQWSRPSAGGDAALGYRNTFTAIPADRLPWRPSPSTPRPRIDGLLLGVVVDSVGDHHGDDGDSADFTYTVRLQLEGDAGAPRVMRLAQPYAGKGFGTHFPLPVGAEVLVAHIDGDPDRPLIAGALPNHDHPSPVREANKTQCVIKTVSGNELRFEDKDGAEHIHLNAKKDLEQIVGGNSTAKVKESVLIEAGKDITIKVGAASIVMEASGKITIKGTQVAVEGSATAEIAAPRIAVKGKAAVEIGAAIVEVKGPMVKVN